MSFYTYCIECGSLKGHCSYDLFFPIGAVLPQYMRETGFHQFPSKPEHKNPFYYAHNIQFWEFFDQSPSDRHDFDEYMSARRKSFEEWHEVFPIASALGPGAKRDRNSVFLVDVGGNQGHDVVSLHKTHPDLPGRLILQDLPAMIERVREASPKQSRPCRMTFLPNSRSLVSNFLG